jgi:hypothetical protein
VFVVSSAIALRAQAPQQSQAAAAAAGTAEVTATARMLTRVESWRFFEPPVADPDYTFIGNRLTFGVKAEGRRWIAEGALQYIQLWDLPPDAFGPGPLGTGAEYHAAAENTKAFQLYPRRLTLTLKDVAPGASLTVGRMGYASGAEAASGVPSIEVVKRQRLDARLLGEFEWSIIQRAFDGVRLDVDRPGWQATAALMMPTQGGYEESATPSITDIQVAALSLTFRPHVALPWSELQLFADAYRDRRPVGARPDNTGRVAPSVDVTVAAFGGSQVGVFPTVAGEADTLVWLAGQFGDWYGQRHAAFSVAAEIGHRWTALDWRPWLRAGYLYASGDGDPRDDRHGTFFQMLPSVRRYAETTTYAQMNVSDLFAEVHLYPHARVSTRMDVHRVDLAAREDRWYAGSGATARDGLYFGYTARPSGGATRFGTVLEGSVDVRLHRYWSLNAYAGAIWGGDLIRRHFVNDRLAYAYVESVIGF